MDFVAIITIVIKFIQECQERRGQSQEQITMQALNRPAGRWLIRQELLRRGVKRGRAIRDAMKTVEQHSMSDDDVRDFVANALVDSPKKKKVTTRKKKVTTRKKKSRTAKE